MDQVDSFPASDAHIFPAYILPALERFTSDEPVELVRIAYAENVAALARIAHRFLEMAQFFKQSSNEDKDGSTYQESYDTELAEIQDAFYEVVVDLFTKDFSTPVKVTLLSVWLSFT